MYAISKHTGCSDDERARIKLLRHMVTYGLPEDTALLTMVDGVGGKWARRLRSEGIATLKDLAKADATKLGTLRGMSEKRAAEWIQKAATICSEKRAAGFGEDPPQFTPLEKSAENRQDRYRARRARELSVQPHSNGRFLVTGGQEPHWVEVVYDDSSCDCPDFAKGHRCKHIIAVAMSQNMLTLQTAEARCSGLSSELIELWSA